MKTFIEMAKYVRTWWQWKDLPKHFRRFRLKVHMGYNPKTGEWQ